MASIDDSDSQRRVMRLVLGHQLSTLSLSLLTMQPRMQLLSKALSGDSTAVARQVNRGAALVALSDLLITPSVGALSDRVGRKPFMLLAPAVALPLKTAVAIWPSVTMLLVERVVCDAFRTLGGTTMSYACLCDRYHGEAYTKALGQLNSATGLGIVMAPLVASVLMGSSGNPRRAYLASAALAVFHLAVGLSTLEETNLSEMKTPSDFIAAPMRTKGVEVKAKAPLIQPVWKFLKLFTNGRRLRLYTCLFALHCLLEGKVLQDQVAILQVSRGWNVRARSFWTSGLGLAILVGGQGTGELVKRLGEHHFMSSCHAASFAAFIGLQSSTFWSSLAFLSLGQQRRSASTSWVISEACQGGVGRGEAVGWIAGLRSAADILSALLYNFVYRARVAKGRPFDVFILPSLVVFLAELLRRHIAATSANARAGSQSEGCRSTAD